MYTFTMVPTKTSYTDYVVLLTMHPLLDLDRTPHLPALHHLETIIKPPKRKNVPRLDPLMSIRARATHLTPVNTVSSLHHLNSRVRRAVSVDYSTRSKQPQLNNSKVDQEEVTQVEDTRNRLVMVEEDTLNSSTGVTRSRGTAVIPV